MGEGPEKEFWIGCRDPLPSSFGKANFQQPRVPQRSLPGLARCGLGARRGPGGADWGSGAVWSVVSGHPRVSSHLLRARVGLLRSFWVGKW